MSIRRSSGEEVVPKILVRSLEAFYSSQYIIFIRDETGVHDRIGKRREAVEPRAIRTTASRVRSGYIQYIHGYSPN